MRKLVELLRGKYRLRPDARGREARELDGRGLARERASDADCLGRVEAEGAQGQARVSLRVRRPRFGELFQIDGSPHDWFEGRGPRCTLIVFIDDATGRLTALRFAPTEPRAAYWTALRDHAERMAAPWRLFGPPRYFPGQREGCQSGDGKTEFNRVATAGDRSDAR